MRFSLPLVPNNVIYIHLFRAVSNSSQLLASLKEADPKVNFCFLDCRRICSINQILCAITRALRDAEDGAMRTKNVYSEIVYSLSPNQNITEALKRFGIATDSENIVCVAIDNEVDTSVILGTEIELTSHNLLGLCDMVKLKEIYRIDKAQDDLEQIEAQILGSIAMRGNL